jgi:tetratricopeptide (TPR) repeat protein
MLSSDKRILVRLFIIVAVIALMAWGGMLLTGPYRHNTKLRQARQEAEAILHMTSQQDAMRHARKCVSLARPLADKQGSLGSTAMVLLVATAPIANADVGAVRLPDEEQLTLVSDQDLLTAAKLMTLSHSFGLADRLVSILLDRTSRDGPPDQQADAAPESGGRVAVNREEVLRMAISVAFELHRDEEVIDHSAELSLLAPDDFAPHQAKSLVYRRQGRLEEFITTATVAKEMADRTGHLQPGDLILLIDAYLELDEPSVAQARREFDRLAEHWPDALKGIEVLHARLLVAEGDTGPAETLLRESLAGDSEDAAAVLLLGTLLVGEERFDEAVEVLEYAIQLSPAEEQAFEQLQQALLGSGEEERAGQVEEYHRFLREEKLRLKALEEQAAEEPGNVDVRMELAQSYARIGMKEHAEFWHAAAQAVE